MSPEPAPFTSSIIPCFVNNYQMKFSPDTGSCANLLGYNHFLEFKKQTGQNPTLKRPSKVLKNASGEPMRVLGCFRARLSSEYHSCVDIIYVLRHSVPYKPLLSENTLLRLGYVRYSLSGAFGTQNMSPPTNVNNDSTKTNNSNNSNDSNNARDFVHNISGNKSEREKDLNDFSDSEMIKKVEELKHKYKNVFVGVGRFRPYKITLQLKENATPFCRKASNIAIHLQAKATERLRYFEKLGIMSKLPPNYPIKYLSPLLVVPKPAKDEVRLVSNFQQLNERLHRTRETPATKLEDFLRKTRGAKFFFRLDLKHGYHQLELDDASKELCLTSTFDGVYMYNRMPMGILNAGDEFDRAIESTLAGCTHTISNRDDILGGHHTRKGMLKELEKVLSALKKAGLTCDPSKTVIGATSIKFFGMIFSEEGMRPDPDKIETLLKAPRPTNQKSLLSFICSCGWNLTFIPRFSELVAPLRQLARTKGKFVWEEIHEKSFQELKSALAKDCLNNSYDETRETYLYCDAGKYTHDKSSPGGFSAILVQIDPKTKRPLVIHYASRAISQTESKWSQVELEARAIRFGCEKFRFYLDGHPGFVVMTDCKPLLPLFNRVPIPKSCPPRIARQIIYLQDLNKSLEHCSGARNLADYHSRWPLKNEKKEDKKDVLDSEVMESSLVRRISDVRENNTVTIDDLKTATNDDPDMQFLIKRILLNDFSKFSKHPIVKSFSAVQHELSVIDHLIFRGEDLIVVPPIKRTLIATLVHELAHSGETNTESLIRSHFYWPNISSFVKNIISNCSVCLHITRLPPIAPAGVTYTPDAPFLEIAADFKGPLPDGSYCLVIIDLFSRYPEIYFTPSTSFKSNKKHFLDYFARAGKVSSVKTDNGPPFNGEEFATFLKNLNIYHKLIIPHRPEANAEVESFMRVISKAVKRAEIENIPLREAILEAVKTKRATPHPATGMSPHQAIHGCKMNIILDKLPTKQTIGLSRKEQKKIQENIIDSKIKAKLKHDSKRNVKDSKIAEGDIVLVRLKKNGNPEPEKFQVISVNNTDVTAISRSGRTVRRHINHFKKIPNAQGQSLESHNRHPTDDFDDEPRVQHRRRAAAAVEDIEPLPVIPANENPVQPPVEDQAQPERRVRFNPVVQTRRMATRSQGPAAPLPNVMSAPLER